MIKSSDEEQRDKILDLIRKTDGITKEQLKEKLNSKLQFNSDWIRVSIYYAFLTFNC